MFGQSPGGTMFGASSSGQTGGSMCGQNTGGGPLGQNSSEAMFGQSNSGAMFGPSTGGVCFDQNTCADMLRMGQTQLQRGDPYGLDSILSPVVAPPRPLGLIMPKTLPRGAASLLWKSHNESVVKPRPSHSGGVGRRSPHNSGIGHS